MGVYPLTSHITGVILNGEKGSKSSIKNMMDALNSREILIEKGGFLFKVSIKGSSLYLGIVPHFILGERTHHFDIDLKVEDAFTLIGSVTDDDVYTLLFCPGQAELSQEQKSVYADTYVMFARFLFENGYQGKGILDWSTMKILEESGIFDSELETLSGIASGTCSRDQL